MLQPVRVFPIPTLLAYLGLMLSVQSGISLDVADLCAIRLHRGQTNKTHPSKR